MKENEELLAKEYDRLESLRLSGTDPAEIGERDLADHLRVLQCLTLVPETPPMPRPDAFRKEVMAKVRPGRVRSGRHFALWGGGLALAASFLVAFLLIGVPTPSTQQEPALMIDPELLDQATAHQTRDAMLSFLESTERLLVAIRDHEIYCAQDRADLGPEKELAKDLLLQQKHFSPEMNNPNYWQARQLFTQLERILVDVNSLDPCTDPLEVDFINEQISEQRILSKLRLVAQEIQIS